MATSFYNLLCSYLLFFFLLFLFVPSANSFSFKLTRFDSENTDIFYEGDAKASVGAVEFNSLSYLCRVGRAAYAEKVRLWDSHSNELSDFTSHFSFSIDTKGSEFYGAGFAFYLASVGFQIPPNSADPPVPHVGINTNSISSAVYTPWNASIHSDDTADVRITYNATTKSMSVSWTYRKTTGSLENSTLSYQIDLMKVLPEWVSVGFSAATGMYVERHQLFSWEFYSSLDAEESNEKKSEMIKLEVSIAVLVGVLIAGAVLTFCIWWRRKYIQKEEEEKINLASMNDDLERGAGPKRFSYKDLRSATKNFSKDRKLGEGGFGAVYKGYIIDLDMPVAVKKISSGSKQGRKEYITEVKIISRLRHRNLVQLIGWCHDRGEFLLVYEFLTNGSLDSHLFGKKSPLTWAVRYKMALGLASVVLYLHEEWEQCVVHRDIKSSNGDFLSAVDERLHTFDETQAECLMIVGLWCAHPDSSLRPTIRKAIQVLNFEAPLPNLPEKMPVPVYQIPTTSFTSTEPSITVSSLDTGR
ncbi:hypothetical protein Pint_27756 [Pistacia integerrima]|uniref:Uncharacterized protein n=1 Tax=Pistacia integerrima TaxID=434235 RepID=A0ACC0YVI5_9ROSI|nr:hypothetical protein Pint_27756 [Pistacia integerrima]